MKGEEGCVPLGRRKTFQGVVWEACGKARKKRIEGQAVLRNIIARALALLLEASAAAPKLGCSCKSKLLPACRRCQSTRKAMQAQEGGEGGRGRRILDKLELYLLTPPLLTLAWPPSSL